MSLVIRRVWREVVGCRNWPVMRVQQFIALRRNVQAFCIISYAYVNSNWSYSPEMAKLGFDLCDLDLWPLTLTFCMDITSAHGNNSWKFHDDMMMGT